MRRKEVQRVRIVTVVDEYPKSFVFKEVDGDISLLTFVEYVVPFLVCKAFVDRCSFDVIGEIVFCASFYELRLERRS